MTSTDAAPGAQSLAGTRTSDAERLARATLCRLAEPGDERLGALVARFGAVAVVEAVRDGSLAAAGARDYRTRLDEASAAKDLDRAARCGARFICPGDVEWPDGTDDLGDRRPWGLWVRGGHDLAQASRRAVAVVGSRDATAYGTDVATDLAAGLAEAGWAVLSGGAFGIDAAAHRGALALGGLTGAVLACGVDLAYPRAHEALLSRVAAEGLVVSELAPGVTPNRPRFLVRNRLIAALSVGTIVVEAAVRSGALSTARHAAGLLRHVMAVPGPVTSESSAGAHDLVRAGGAVLVTGVGDVLELVGRVGEYLPAERRGASHPRDDLDPRALRVLEALPVRRAAPLLRIVREAGLAPDTVLRMLGVLDALGLAEQHEDGWRLSAEERARVIGASDDSQVGA